MNSRLFVQSREKLIEPILVNDRWYDRKCPPGRVRDELLSVAGRLARDGETQLKHSPGNPGRFTHSG